MARPSKNGLSYFSLDVDIFSDNKIKFVRARFDEKGELMTIKLLCDIYRNGYYTEWNDDISLIFSDSAGKNFTANLANDVVHELVKRGFFDGSIFDRFHILTSKGIQRRFLEASRNRKDIEIIADYWLIDLPENTKNTTFLISYVKNGVSYVRNGENDVRNDTKENKRKENKINKRERDASASSPAFKSGFDDDFDETISSAKHKYGEYNWVLLTDEEYKRLIKEFGEDMIAYYLNYVDESAQSTKNKNKWKDWNLVIRKAIRDKWGKYEGENPKERRNY